jgi:hypothetical protein
MAQPDPLKRLRKDWLDRRTPESGEHRRKDRVNLKSNL